MATVSPLERPLAGARGVPDRTLYSIADDHFIFECEDAKCQFHVERFRYDNFGNARASIRVETALAGGKVAPEGIIGLFDDLNLSRGEDKERAAKQLAANAPVKGVNYAEIVEDLSLRVRLKAQKGTGSIRLADAAPAQPDPTYDVDGIKLQKYQPAIFAGPGDTGKSFLALYLSGRLQQQGAQVLFLDYEMDAHVHRSRLESLFGASLPNVRYLRLSRPLVFERSRIAAEIHQWGINYLVVDSLGQACKGRLTEEDSANEFTRTLRTFTDVGSLSIAHMPKPRPEDKDAGGSIFGSVYFFNNARLVYHLRQVPEASGEDRITIAAICKKSNLSKKPKSVGFEIRFDADGQAKVRRAELADLPSVAGQLTIVERLRHVLKHGARSWAEIEQDLEGQNLDSIKRKVRWGLESHNGRPPMFVKVTGPTGERIALAENFRAA